MRPRFSSSRLLLALALLLTVAGCAQPESKPAPAVAPAPAKSGEAAAPKPAAQPAQPAPANVADTLTIAYPGNLETIDPHQSRAVLTDAALALVYENLITRDPKTMELKPLLATSWRNVDPLTWEIKLRQGVKFANGEEFTAEHVKAMFERAMSAKLSTSVKTYWGTEFPGTVEAVDKSTVRIKTKEPDAVLESRLAPMPITMVPKAISALMDKYVTTPEGAIGSGPYRITEHVIGDHTTLERREDYWGEKPPTKRIVFKIVPDAQTRVAALQRGEVDVVVNLLVPLVPIVERDPNLTVYSVLGSTTHAIMINTRKGGPLAEEKVRQALNYAVDKESLLKALYAGRGKPLKSIIAAQIPGGETAPVYAFDPKKAKALLAEAGYANGFETTLWQAQGRWPQALEAAQVIAGFWKDIGVRADVKTLEWAEYNRRAITSQFEGMHYYAFTNLQWDPAFPLQRFTPEYKRFEFYIAGGDTLAAAKKYFTTFDVAQRKQHAQKFAEDLNRQAAWVYLYQLEEIYGLNKKVKNFVMRPDHEVDLRQTYKER